MPEQTDTNKKSIMVPAIVGGTLVILALVAGSFVLLSKDSKTSADNNSNNTSQTNSSTQITKYKDGTYTAVGSYVSPGGAQKVQVTLTLTNGIISDIKITPKASDPTSQMHQEDFARGISNKISGQTINSDLNIGNVNGSSLTGTGFKDALEKIKTEAKV